MKTAGVVVGVVVVILVGLGITTIWRDSPGPEPTTAEAWTTNMSQLGIRPVYPPSEDLHVGDLWAVAVEANPAPGTRPVTPLLSQGVRIGHVPLREAIIAASHRRPVFAARSIEPGSPQHAPWMEISELPQAERIGLAEVGFPSVVRRRTLRASGSGSYLLASLRGGADETIVEEISVPQAVGYGTDSAVAAIALARWCGEQAGLCNQTTLRRILRFALGRNAIGDNAGIEVLMINYIFATREIQLNRQRESVRSLDGGVRAPDAGGTPAPAVEASASGSSSQVVKTTSTFVRPVVIGFRGVSIEAPTSPP